MKQLSILISVFTMMLLVSSCGKETCQTCEITQTIYENGVEFGSQMISTNQEYCGDELDSVKDLEATTTQTLDGLTLETITVVTCK